MAKNGLTHWPQLEYAGDPGTWQDADMLDVSELEFLRSFIRMGKRTPLYAILITHPPRIKCPLINA